jgi:hypothetical protein
MSFCLSCWMDSNEQIIAFHNILLSYKHAMLLSEYNVLMHEHIVLLYGYEMLLHELEKSIQQHIMMRHQLIVFAFS